MRNDLSMLFDLFARYEKPCGVMGIALGWKQVAGRPIPHRSVAFFVQEKHPRRGGRRRLASGQLCVPRKVSLGSGNELTDVVVPVRQHGPVARARAPVARLRAGGPLSNLHAMGSFGCLVRKPRLRDDLFAMTNRHVALGVGTIVYFPNRRTGAIAARTEAELDLVADERFNPLFDLANGYVDVDAAMVRLPRPQHHRFSASLPYLGTPESIYIPDFSNPGAYSASLLGLPVSAYSWNSKLRHGAISHVHYVTRRPSSGTVVAYSFLVESTDGRSPGLERDSGKVWVTNVSGALAVVGLHQGGVASTGGSSRFAVATEFHSIARLMRFGLA